MNLREMNMADYASVHSLWMSCVGMGLNDIDDSEDGIRRFLARNPRTCFIAEESDEVLGVILAGNDGRRGYIYHTAVKPSARGNRIGTRLVQQVLDELRLLGISKVALVVFKGNQVANAFWQHQGFTLREDIFYRNTALRRIRRIDT